MFRRLTLMRDWRPGSLAKGTFAMTAGMGLRTIAQAGVFLIVARVLGVEAYGAYAAVLAIAGTLGSFGGLGTQILMLRDVARDPQHFAVAWGRVLAAVVVSAPVLFGIYLLLAWIVLPSAISWYVIVFIGVAELVFAPLTLAGISAYQGHERIGRAARLVLISVLPRLLGAIALVPLALWLPPGERLLAWSVLYALAGCLAVAYSIRLVHRDLGYPHKPEGLWRYLSEGVTFAFGGAALKLYLDIDKTMLAKLSTLEVAGAYSAGNRLVDMAVVPLNALLASTLHRFFREGESGTQGTISYGWRILPLPLLYAAAVGVFVYSIAQWLPLILGAGYQGAIVTLQWLAWLPLVSLPRLLLQSSLMGSDRQRAVVYVLSMGAVLNITLNLWLIPLLSWRGAVVSTYAAEIVMAFALLWFVQYYKRRGI